MRAWKGTLHWSGRSQLARNVQNWGWPHVDGAWFDFLWRFKITYPNFHVQKYHSIGISITTSTLTMGCFDSNTTFRYTLWYGMAMQNFPKIHCFLHLSKTLASNTQDVKPCFYTISWHVEEWSTGVWGKWFTDMGLSRGLICHASHSHALFPSSLCISQRQHAAHCWQWKGLPSHSSN